MIHEDEENRKWLAQAQLDLAKQVGRRNLLVPLASISVLLSVIGTVTASATLKGSALFGIACTVGPAFLADAKVRGARRTVELLEEQSKARHEVESA